MNDNYSDEKLKKKLLKSVNHLLNNDSFLLKNGASERSISHKLAEYVQKEFPKWHVDCEYNRDLDDVKKRPDDTGFNPDIVVHIRDTDKNLLIIEVKKSNGEYNDEENRLKEATTPKYQYHYQLGVFIMLNVLDEYRKNPTINFFKYGVQMV